MRLALQDYLRKVPGAARGAPDRVREASGAPGWGGSEPPGSERTILLRRVPEELYQALEARAARERLSPSDYLLDILKRREFLERLRSRSRVTLGVSAADLIREDRDSR